MAGPEDPILRQVSTAEAAAAAPPDTSRGSPERAWARRVAVGARRAVAWARREELWPSSPAARRGLWWVLGAFAAVRVAFVASGGGFSTKLLFQTWQLLDARYLASDPFGSVLALHIQPPLFNLFIGGVMAWSPLPLGLSLQVGYLACGLVAVVGLYLLLLDLGFSARAAAVGGVVVALDPTMLGYENVIAYEVPTAAMVIVVALCLVRWVRTGRIPWLVGLAVALLATVMTRALFHPVWMAGVFVLALVARRPSRRWVAAVVVVLAFTPVVGWMFKNQLLVGDFTLSSWFGMNISKSTVATLPLRDIDELVAEGRLSPNARMRPFAKLREYQGLEPGCDERYHRAVLSARYLASLVPNYNAYCYVSLYRQAGHDAVAALRARPGRFLATRRTSFVLHFSEARALASPETPVTRALRSAWSVALVKVPVRPSDLHFDLVLLRPSVQFSLVLLAGTALVLVRGARAVPRVLRRRDPSAAGWVYVGGTAGFVFLTSMLFEFGENGRFELLIQRLVVGVAVASVAETIEKLVERRKAPEAGGEGGPPDGGSGEAVAEVEVERHGPGEPSPSGPLATGA